MCYRGIFNAICDEPKVQIARDFRLGAVEMVLKTENDLTEFSDEPVPQTTDPQWVNARYEMKWNWMHLVKNKKQQSGVASGWIGKYNFHAALAYGVFYTTKVVVFFVYIGDDSTKWQHKTATKPMTTTTQGL